MFDELVLNLKNLKTLIHELGHGLYDLCNTTDRNIYTSDMVEGDGIEFPSMFAECLVLHPEILENMAYPWHTPTHAMLMKYKLLCLEDRIRSALFNLRADRYVYTDTPIDLVALYAECFPGKSQLTDEMIWKLIMPTFSYDGIRYCYTLGELLGMYVYQECAKDPKSSLECLRREVYAPGASRTLMRSLQLFLGKDDSWFPNPDILCSFFGEGITVSAK